jgi:hypothetical protein
MYLHRAYCGLRISCYMPHDFSYATRNTLHVWYNRRTKNEEQTVCNLMQLWLDCKSALAAGSR